LKREAFWDQVARIEPDRDYWADTATWDRASAADFAGAQPQSTVSRHVASRRLVESTVS
jgi:hypothetical protein